MKMRKNPMSLTTTLSEVTEQTFEALAFMFSMPEDQEPRCAVSVDFHGPSEGTLYIWVPNTMLAPLAANMLGMDDGAEPTQEEQFDALRELANVICGNLLPKIAGPKAVFRLDAPVVETDENAVALPPERPNATTHVVLDTGKAEIELYVNPIPEPPTEA
jgi:chemotaxis protein CheX